MWTREKQNKLISIKKSERRCKHIIARIHWHPIDCPYYHTPWRPFLQWVSRPHAWSIASHGRCWSGCRSRHRSILKQAPPGHPAQTSTLILKSDDFMQIQRLAVNPLMQGSMAEQYFITESRCTQASKSQQHLLMAQHVE